MKIHTITCHDVYNLGASLQAYALAAYLAEAGHEVSILDYKPPYLSRHYALSYVANPRYDKPLLRQAYLLAKLPKRLWALRSRRKKRFDAFRRGYLPVTPRRYVSAEDLKANCPPSDLFIAGSDQIWNPTFENGKDPAFFLTFVPQGAKKIAYAASFAVETLSEADVARMKPWLTALDAIAVREQSGVTILDGMGLPAVCTVDPVFLLPRENWERLSVLPKVRDYILVYDFDGNPLLRRFAREKAKAEGRRLVSVFPMEGADAVWGDMGPREFLGAIQNAACVISNSFHATAFSLIFERDFYVFGRKEHINTRMADLVADVGLCVRLVIDPDGGEASPIPWSSVREALERRIGESRTYLSEHTKG